MGTELQSALMQYRVIQNHLGGSLSQLFIQSTMADDLRSLAQLYLTNHEVKKACVLGLIIDSSAAYKTNNERDYIRKIKIIDPSLNEDQTYKHVKYCTVMFFGKTPEDLPQPTKIGQVLYLRRYDFNIWNDKFQAKRTAGNISSWILFSGDASQAGFNYISTSRPDISLNSDKYLHLFSPIRELRHFSTSYLKEHSVLSAVDVKTKDFDLVLKVKDSVGNDYLLTNGAQGFTAKLDQKILVGSVVKIRSVDSLEGSHLVNNEYTYAMELEPWMKTYHELSLLEENKETKTHVTLRTLKELPNSGRKETWNVRCEVIDISPKSFKEAVTYYNPYQNKLTEDPKEARVVYNIRFLLKDLSLPESELFEAHLFSWDSKGSDFLPTVRLTEIQMSSLKAESELYEQKINKLLEESSSQNLVDINIESCPTSKKLLYRVLRTNW